MAAFQPKHVEAADNIRQRHDRRSKDIRNRKELTDDARIGLLAKSYRDAKSQMAELQKSAAADVAEQQAKAERILFGTSDLPGDRGTAAVSYRDAQDRCVNLKNATDAAALLARAERSDDEPLARAIAAVAYDRLDDPLAAGDSGWSDIIDHYVSTRPTKAKAVQQLVDLSQTGSAAAAMFTFVLPAPSELTGIPSGQVDALVSRERVGFTLGGCSWRMAYVVGCCCAGAAERPR